MELDTAKPRPHPTPTSQPFWDALAAGRVDLQRCDDCGQWVHYPRARCSRCLSPRLSWQTVDGAGTVYTFSIARQATAMPFEADVPQILAVVELPEGVRLSTTLVGVEPGAVRVGMPVIPVFAHGTDSITLLHYRPLDHPNPASHQKDRAERAERAGWRARRARE